MKIANQIYKYSYIKSIFQGIRYYKYLQTSKICQSSSPRHISLEHPLSLHHNIHITNNQNIHIYLYTYIQRNQKNQRLIGSSEQIYQKSEQFLSYLCKNNLITYIPANNKLSLEQLTYKFKAIKIQFSEKVSNLQQNQIFVSIVSQRNPSAQMQILNFSIKPKWPTTTSTLFCYEGQRKRK